MSNYDEIVESNLSDLFSEKSDSVIQALIDDEDAQSFAYGDDVTTYIHESIEGQSINNEDRQAIIDGSNNIEEAARDYPFERDDGILDNKLDMWATTALGRDVNEKVADYFSELKDSYTDTLDEMNEHKDCWQKSIIENGVHSLLSVEGGDPDDFDPDEVIDEFESNIEGLVARYTVDCDESSGPAASDLSAVSSVEAQIKEIERYIELKAVVKVSALELSQTIDTETPKDWSIRLRGLSEFNKLSGSLSNKYRHSSDDALRSVIEEGKLEIQRHTAFIDGLDDSVQGEIISAANGEILPFLRNVLTATADDDNIRFELNNISSLLTEDAFGNIALTHLAEHVSRSHQSGEYCKDLNILLQVAAGSIPRETYDQSRFLPAIALILESKSVELLTTIGEIYITEPNMVFSLPEKMNPRLKEALSEYDGMSLHDIAAVNAAKNGDFTALAYSQRKGGQLTVDGDMPVFKAIVKNQPSLARYDRFIEPIIKQHLEQGVSVSEMISVTDDCSDETFKAELVNRLLQTDSGDISRAPRKPKL